MFVWALAAYVLLAQVGTVDVQRVRLLAAPAGPHLSITLALPSLRASSRTAIVCRIRNDGDQPLHVTATLGGTTIGARTVGARQTVRFDASGPASAGELVLRGDREWILTNAELANVHGVARGLVNLFVIPAGQAAPTPPGWLIVLLCVAGGALLLVPPAACAEWLRWTHRAIGAAVVLLFAAAAVSRHVSPYSVVLDPRTFALGCAWLLAPRIVTVARRGLDRMATAPRAAIAATGIAGAVFFASALVQETWRFDGNYTGLLHVSRAYARSLPFLEEHPDIAERLLTSPDGYDGQFMWGLAFDPTLHRFRDDPVRYETVADSPVYRYGRIGFSALIATFAFRQPAAFVFVQVWLIVLGHLLLGCALAAYAADRGWHPAAALAYLAIPGFMPSLLFALPESLAAAGLVAGLLAWHRDRRWLAVACFGAASLVRETVLLVPVCLAVVELWKRRPHAAIVVGTAFLPATLWRVYVWTRLSQVYGARALYEGASVLDVPFEGLARLVRASLLRTQPDPEQLAGLTFPIVLACLFFVAIWFMIRRADGLSLAAVGYGLVAVSLSYAKVWSHVPSGERGSYELFLCLLILALSEPRMRGRWLAIAAGGLAAYMLFASPEAYATRAALLLVR